MGKIDDEVTPYGHVVEDSMGMWTTSKGQEMKADDANKDVCSNAGEADNVEITECEMERIRSRKYNTLICKGIRPNNRTVCREKGIGCLKDSRKLTV